MVQREEPFNRFVDIAPDDTADLPAFTARKVLTGAVYVGSGGDIVAVMADNSTQTFTVLSGTYHPWAVRRINASNTTAEKLVACYIN